VFLRIDKLQVELPAPAAPDQNAAAALQALLGGKYDEMSTLNNYLFISFNFRRKANFDHSRNWSPALPKPRS
jgi:Mn-containing catalase